MSSADEDTLPLSKKRKLQRACDYCRRKKIKCDGPQMPNKRCSKCISRGLECTYTETMQKTTYPSGYVENLESRLERMEKLMEKLCPDGDISKELEGLQSDKDHPAQTPVSERSQQSSSLQSARPLSSPALAVTPQTPTGSDDFEPSDDEADEVNQRLGDRFCNLSIGSEACRYYGKSSGIVFIRNALALGKGPLGSNQPGERWRVDPRRNPWIRPTVDEEMPPFSDFPPQDLMDNLVELFFRNLNDYFPLLHEPTFKMAIENGLHLRHSGFGATVLLVCANASRFTRDPRVLDETYEEQSAGFKWFQQVEKAKKPPTAPAQLHDLQIYILMISFLDGTVAKQKTWALIGIGIRAAVDVGAHRRSMYSMPPTQEEELWKRAFWILVLLEWVAGHGLGRPTSIHDEDIDVLLPIEVDDEYWTTEDGQVVWKQPPNKPSKLSYFNYSIRLAQVLDFASRTVYSINKSRVQLVHGDQQWERRIVAELDSALNKWIASLPSHLRWDPDQPNHLFLHQAGSLFASYYQFQIAVHRPFILPRRESPLSFTSLIICTNAARASVQVLDTVYQRTGTPRSNNAASLFMSGTVLAINVLAERRSGRNVHADRDLAYVQKCLDMIKLVKYEAHISERFWDVLNDLMMAANGTVTLEVASAEHEGTSRTEELGESLFTSNSANQSAGVSIMGGTSKSQTDTVHQIQPGPSLASKTFAQSVMDNQSIIPRSQSSGTQQAAPTLPYPLTSHLEELGRTASYDHPRQSYPSPPTSAYFPQARGSGPFPSDVLHDHFGYAPSQATRAAPVDSAPGIDFGSGAGGAMFELEPLGYSEAVSFHPSVHALPEGAGHGYAGTQAPPDHPGMWTGETPPQGGGDAADAASMADFAFLDDTFTMLSNAPRSFGWDEWGMYLNSVNDPRIAGP